MSPVRKSRPAAESSRPENTAAEPLFRREVLAEQQTQWLGTVLLETKSVYSRIAVISIATIVAFIALLFLGSFSRKTTVSGWLVPQQGLARILSPQPGIIAAINVIEGTKVTKGEPLLSITAEVQSEGLVATRQEAVRRLALRRDSMVDSKSSQESVFEEQVRELNQRAEKLATELKFLGNEISLQRSRVQLSQQMLARENEMRARGLIPLPRVQRTKQEELDQTAKLQSLERSRSALQRELAGVQSQRKEMPLRRRTQLGEIDRNVSGLEQELAEAEIRRKIVLVAPQDGIVTALQAELGGTISTALSLLTIVPAGAVLQAHLYAPSRGIGFVKAGQRVQLRFQSFPYQKFGFHEGVVSAVARAAAAPSELPQSLSGTGGAGALNEPVYRITIDIPKQHVMAYGQNMQLQSGMRVDADIFIENRRLIEWMFDPLLSITGKWSG